LAANGGNGYVTGYYGAGSGGYNLFTWFGASSCSGGYSASWGISQGDAQSFGVCYAGYDYYPYYAIFDNPSSTLDDKNTYVVTPKNEDGTYTLSVYENALCAGGTLLWTLDLTENGCECTTGDFRACVQMTIPKWEAFVGESNSCSDLSSKANGFKVENGSLLKDECVNGTELGIGFYVLWIDDDYNGNAYHELNYQCDQNCLHCANTWFVSPGDCKCDSKNCLLAVFNSPAPTMMASITLVATLFLYMLF